MCVRNLQYGSLFRVFLVTLFMSLPLSRLAYAEGGGAYAHPSFEELVRTMIMLEAVDIEKEKEIVNEYIRLMYCDLYEETYSDDFEWQNVRQGIFHKLNSKNENYRVLYQIAGWLELEKYDFNQKIFPITKQTALSQVGKLTLFSTQDFKGYCDVSQYGLEQGGPRSEFDQILPRHYSVSLHKPINLTHLKMNPDQARKFLEKLDRLKIYDRSVYVRIRIRVTAPDEVNIRTHGLAGEVTFLGAVTSVDLFFDKKLTQWFGRIDFRDDGDE